MKCHAVHGCPGTGKTTYLTQFVEELSKDTPNMAILSFSRAAAAVLTSRLKVPVRTIGTIHSLAFHSLNMTRSLVAQPEEFIKWYNGDLEEIKWALNIYQYACRTGKEITEAYSQFASSGMYIPFLVVEHIIKSYINWKKSFFLLDFDDMLIKTIAEFKDDKYDVVVVDEAQDLSPIQWELIKVITKKMLVIVGDADQCQPTGTKILTNNGIKNIENLDKDIDKILSYGSKRGSVWSDFKISNREYSGLIYEVNIKGNKSRYTPTHKCLVKFNTNEKIFQVEAMNLHPELMMMGIYSNNKHRTPEWHPFSMKKENYNGIVWSLDINSEGKTYCADNIWTHNSIYVWAGADPHGMEKMTDDITILDQSYRLPKTVQSLAQTTIRQIKNRLDKEYKPVDREGKIEIQMEYDPFHIKGPHVVLCRDHWGIAQIVDQLIQYKIPYIAEKSLFYSAIMNTIKAIISGDGDKIKKRYRYFKEEYRQNAIDGKLPNSRWDIMLNLSRCTEQELEYYELVDPLAEPLVELSTIHSWKGKEADHVIVDTACGPTVQNAMDCRISFDDEIRVWYVGITRTKEKLTILGSNSFLPV
jgi:superfamily I DNA/RNA helicase